MAIKKSQLYSALWEGCNKLRGGMDASQYKDYVLVIEYVVVHELTHLRVQNHSKVFEALLTQRLPNWRNLRKQLNEFIAMPL